MGSIRVYSAAYAIEKILPISGAVRTKLKDKILSPVELITVGDHLFVELLLDTNDLEILAQLIP
jgi:hypothetical protein